MRGQLNAIFFRKVGLVIRLKKEQLVSSRGTQISTTGRLGSISIIFLVYVLIIIGCGGGGDDTQPGNTNVPPTANAGGGAERVVNPGEPVILNGSGSIDPDGEIVSFLWAQISGLPVVLTGTTTVSASFVAPMTDFRELLVFRLSVQDNAGAQSSDDVTITVNAPPTADAGPNQFADGASLVELSGTADDVDGFIASDLWEQIEGPGVVLSGATTPTLSFFAPETSQTLTFRYTVIDNDGARHFDSVSVFVNQVLFSDSFDDASSLDNWVDVSDVGVLGTGNWQVLNGKYRQENVVYRWLGSYHLGTYSYYKNGLTLSDYQVRLNLKSNANISGSRDSIGVMVRYQNPDNYIRFLMSRMSGFLRLESRVGGQFKALSHSGRGINLGEEYEVLIDVRCGEQSCSDGADNDGDGLIDEYIIFVYLNDEPIFSAQDVGPQSGTVALFTQGRSEFDNVVISEPPVTPRVILQQPLAYSVAVTDATAGPYELQVLAQAINGPPSYGVKFSIDSGLPNEIIDFTGGFSGTFTDVPRGERTVSAIMVDQDGEPIAVTVDQDAVFNIDVGVGGKFLVGFGDSITNGVGDDRSGDNDSSNVKVFGRGYTPILTSRLSNYFGASVPVTVVNEGLGGTTAQNGWDRLNETLARYPGSQVWLLLFGTNDSSGGGPTDTFKVYMRNMVRSLKAQGQVPVLAYVPYVRNPNPTNQNIKIQEYNQAISELFVEEKLPVVPPDFYQLFLNNQSLFFDAVHPNGNGYVEMARLWYQALVNSDLF